MNAAGQIIPGEGNCDAGIYQLIFETSPDGIVLINCEGNIVRTNAAQAELYGYDNPEEMIGKHALKFLAPSSRDRAKQTMQRRLQGEDIPTVQYELLRKDGTTFFGEVTATLVRDPQGAVIGYINITRDITERKLIEKKLQAGEEKFRTIFALSPDIISILNENGYLVYNSPNAFAVHGYPEEEMQRRNTFELIHPDDQLKVTVAFTSLLDAPAEIAAVQYRYRNKDGSYVWMEATASNQLANPLIQGIVVISRNIADRKKMEEQRLVLERNLLHAQKLESLGVLAGGIAHDFNNILTGIVGNISLARKNIEESHRAHDLLRRAEKASQRASVLSKRLMVFAKGGLPVKSRFSLHHVLDEALALALAGTNVKVILHMPETLHAVEADEGQINQVFHNIILNAIHAMPEGGTLTIQGEMAVLKPGNDLRLSPGHYVKLSITDEGTGISEEHQKKIFDPYFTTKAGGMGLGLASAYAIIKNHGGHISVVSEVGVGTTFELYLPSLSGIHIHEDRETGEATVKKTSLSILVMDDEEMIRDLAAMALEGCGHAVKTCVNGLEAVSLYKAAHLAGTPFSAVLMDLTIPGGMGGVEAAQQILAFDPAARLVVSTGYSADPVMADHRSYGFSAAIAKPYEAESINEVIASVLF